tara:strand:+ start:1429 stop:2025 length:597 start_codon:yes stop_codon:yes gene_type:complete
MFDLNDKGFNGTVIFNNGQGGKVEGVSISVEKKDAEQPDTYPAYKLIVEDATGGKINQGFYYPTPKQGDSEENNMKRIKREVGRVIHIARAVVGNEPLPTVSNAKEAYDVLFKLINDKAVGQTFNVFATYGTAGYASKYLGLRYFDFIENTSLPTGRLSVKNGDLLDRVVEDDSASDDMSMDATSSTPTGSSIENWNA